MAEYGARRLLQKKLDHDNQLWKYRQSVSASIAIFERHHMLFSGRGESPVAKFVPGDCMGQPSVKVSHLHATASTYCYFRSLPRSTTKRRRRFCSVTFGKRTSGVKLFINSSLINNQFSVIPKSTNPERVRQNIEIFDFQLTEEDTKKLDAISPHTRLFTMSFAEHHPFYPFNEPY